MPGQSTTRDPALTRIVERQMRNWELARTQHPTDARQEPAEVAEFIAVSRQVGAGGAEVAAMLGERLGWPVFDKTILQVMAGTDEIRRKLYDSMDERDIGWFEEALRAFADPAFVKNDYFHRLVETVLFIARKSPAVFLGRAVDLILPRQAGFRVRLVAPLDNRLSNFTREFDVSGDEARQQIPQLDSQRAEFTRKHFATEPDDPQRYDLIVNMASFEPSDAAELIFSARAKLRRLSPDTA